MQTRNIWDLIDWYRALEPELPPILSNSRHCLVWTLSGRSLPITHTVVVAGWLAVRIAIALQTSLRQIENHFELILFRRYLLQLLLQFVHLLLDV